MTYQDVAAFVQRHQESLGLFALAMAVTMAEKLPWPFCRLEMLEWAYEWLRRGVMAFVSFRGPVQHSETQSKITTDGDKTVVTTKTESSEIPPATPAAGPVPAPVKKTD